MLRVLTHYFFQMSLLYIFRDFSSPRSIDPFFITLELFFLFDYFIDFFANFCICMFHFHFIVVFVYFLFSDVYFFSSLILFFTTLKLPSEHCGTIRNDSGRASGAQAPLSAFETSCVSEKRSNPFFFFWGPKCSVPGLFVSGRTNFFLRHGPNRFMSLRPNYSPPFSTKPILSVSNRTDFAVFRPKHSSLPPKEVCPRPPPICPPSSTAASQPPPSHRPEMAPTSPSPWPSDAPPHGVLVLGQPFFILVFSP